MATFQGFQKGEIGFLTQLHWLSHARLSLQSLLDAAMGPSIVLEEEEDTPTSGTACSRLSASSAFCNLRLAPTPSERAAKGHPVTTKSETAIASHTRSHDRARSADRQIAPCTIMGVCVLKPTLLDLMFVCMAGYGRVEFRGL